MVMEKERGGRAKDGGHQGRQAKITPVAAYMCGDAHGCDRPSLVMVAVETIMIVAPRVTLAKLAVRSTVLSMRVLVVLSVVFIVVALCLCSWHT